MATATGMSPDAASARTTVHRFSIVLTIAATAVIPFGPMASGAQAQRVAAPGGTAPPMMSNLATRHGFTSFHSNVRADLPARPITAARALVHVVDGIQPPCYPRNVNQWYLASRGCPVTPRFQRYLHAHMRDSDPICQCQNVALHTTFRLLFQRAGVAVVAATLPFTYYPLYIVLVEVNRGSGWAVTANYVTHR